MSFLIIFEDCSSNCLTCSGDTNHCTSCDSASSLKYLSNEVCYETCPDGTYESSSSTCDGKSQNCFREVFNLLKDCSSNCFTCSETADYCTSCSSLQYLSHGVCYATCPPGTYEASSSTCDGKS